MERRKLVSAWAMLLGVAGFVPKTAIKIVRENMKSLPRRGNKYMPKPKEQNRAFIRRTAKEQARKNNCSLSERY